jgi:hypothetical protein
VTTNRDQVLHLVRTSNEPLDDDQISRQTGIAPRQSVNIICRALVKDGLVRRVPGPGGKIVNQWAGDDSAADAASVAADPTSSRLSDDPVRSTQVGEAPPGSSQEQRDAERVLLDLLGERLGLRLDPARITIPSGARVEIDGTDTARSVLVECWAHQGPPKAAQKHKVLSDALKLTWIATTVYPRPRLILCMSDPAAAAPFAVGARSWASQALADLGVEVAVVELPEATRAAVVAAQQRQYR